MAFRKIDLQQLETDIADIQDPLVLLNHGQSGNNTRDLGFIMERGSYDNVGIIWDESSDEFALVTTTDSGATVGNVTISSYSNLQAGTVTASSFVGPLTGNADTATALATVRTIAGQSFDGSANIAIASTDLSNTSNITLNNATQTLTNKTLTTPVISTISNTGTLTLPTSTGTVALTSDITLSTLSITATASEINELSGVTSNIQTQLDDKLSSSGGTISNNLTVTGNLTVNGVTTTVNSTVVEIADPIMTLGSDASDDNKDRGIAFKWNSGGNTKVGFFGYDDSDGKFSFITDGNVSNEITSGTLGTIKVGGIDLDGTTITATGTELNYVDGVTSNIQTQIDGKQSPLTHNENSSPYVITTSDAANNSSSTLAISASTLGFNLTGAISYTIFINRLYLRSSEVSVNTNNGTLTFSTGILDDSDEIDAVWIT
jgi:hypothetical protein